MSIDKEKQSIVRNEYINNLIDFISYSKTQVQDVLFQLNWSEDQTTFKENEKELTKCPVNQEHSISKKHLQSHKVNCLWHQQGYKDDNESFPPASISNVALNVDKTLQEKIISDASRKNAQFKCGDNVGTRGVPQTTERLMTDFTAYERKALYEHVITRTAALVPWLKEFSLPNLSAPGQDEAPLGQGTAPELQVPSTRVEDPADYQEYTIHKITSWPLSWFDKGIETKHNEWSEHEVPTYELRDSYKDYGEYRSHMFPLLLHHLQSSVSRQYNLNKQSNAVVQYLLDIQEVGSIPIKNVLEPKDQVLQLKTLTCQVCVETKMKSKWPRRGDLVELRCVIQGCDPVGGSVAFIDRMEVQNLNESRLKVDLLTKAEFTIKKHDKAKLVVLKNIEKELTLFKALYAMAASPLQDIILRPNENKVELQDITHEKHYLLTKLNASQRRAVTSVASAFHTKTNMIQVVHGPPGTGKTEAIVAMILQMWVNWHCNKNSEKFQILVCAPTGVAVDEICLRLIELHREDLDSTPEFSLVRIGDQDSIHEEVLDWNLDTLTNKKVKPDEQNEKKSLMEMDILGNASVIATTVSSTYNTKMQNAIKSQKLQLWCCIVDEANGCTEVENLLPVMLGVGLLVLVGDQKALSATVISKKARECGLEKSLLSRQQGFWTNLPRRDTDNIRLSRSRCHLLEQQFRMPEQVQLWPYNYFYAGALAGYGIPKPDDDDCPLKQFVLVQHKDENQERSEIEAQLIANVIKCIDAREDCEDLSIGVITLNKQQRELIRSKMVGPVFSGVEVGTVGNYHNREKDVVLVSCCRITDHGISDQHLLMAATRAKQSLIVVGDFRSVTKGALSDYINKAKQRRRNVDLDDEQNSGKPLEDHIFKNKNE